MMVTVRSTPAAGQARRQGAAVSRSLPGFVLGPLQLKDARVSPIRDLGQNLQGVAPEALGRLPRPGGVAVDPELGAPIEDGRFKLTDSAILFPVHRPLLSVPHLLVELGAWRLPEERFCQTDCWNGSSSSGR